MKSAYVTTHRWTDKENVLLFSHNQEWNNAICWKMNGIWSHNVKWNKPDSFLCFYSSVESRLKKKKTWRQKGVNLGERRPVGTREHGWGWMTAIHNIQVWNVTTKPTNLWNQ
jgi:hypothetical protein